jgi:hypothetical protein
MWFILLGVGMSLGLPVTSAWQGYAWNRPLPRVRSGSDSRAASGRRGETPISAAPL